MRFTNSAVTPDPDTMEAASGTEGQLDDAALLARLRGGDEDAFMVLANRHEASMLRVWGTGYRFFSTETANDGVRPPGPQRRAHRRA